MKRRLLTWMSGVIFVTGVALALNGSWIHLKAIIAQQLLQLSWEQTLLTQKNIKPWWWADSYPIARLRVDRLEVDYIVQEGDRGSVLAFGPGHVPASASPFTMGNCILAGHRDTSFSFLSKITIGDVVELDDKYGKTHKFEIVGTEVQDRNALYFEQGTSSWLTLITCYPFVSVNPSGNQRFVVSARKVNTTHG